jgi:hypothetical protein
MAQRSNFGDETLLLGLVVIGLYLFFKNQVTAAATAVTGAVSDANAALASAGASIGGTIFDVLNPPSGANQLFYTIYFPDLGVSHAIDSYFVDSNGFFTYGGNNYRMGRDAKGNRVAVPQS